VTRPDPRPSLRHEKLCLAPVAGVDEAGRGPLAGPVVAAAVILPARGIPRGIDDSKKLSHTERLRLHDRHAATAIVSGDAISLSIAAASIIAKHTRDLIMLAHAEHYPHYGWHTNKGYGSRTHLAALREHGPTPLHRRSFAPVAQAYLDL
jgi:ribonuclease HII